VSEGVLVFRSRHSAPVIADLVTRFAAAFDVITGAQTITDGHLDGRIIRGLVTQRLVTADAPHTPTPHGLAWRASYTGAIAPIEAVTARKRRKWKTKPKPAPKETPAKKHEQRARELGAAMIERGTLFVHKKMLEHLGMECFYLWSYSRTHPELTTVEQLAAAVHWSLSDTSIRAERCGDRGYPLALKQEDAA
jgi:hypothetical protein